MNRTLNHDFQETMVDIYSTGGAHRRKRGGLRRKAIALVAAGAVLVCAIGAGIYFYMEKQRQSSLLNGGTFYEGISVAAVDLGGKTMAEAKAALKQKEPSLREPCSIAVTCSGKSWKVTEDDLDFHFDTDKVLNEAYAYARTGDEKKRLSQIEGLKKSPKNYPLSSTVTYETRNHREAGGRHRRVVRPGHRVVPVSGWQKRRFRRYRRLLQAGGEPCFGREDRHGGGARQIASVRRE